MNLKIRLFEDKLLELCNTSDIPIEAKRLAIEDVLKAVKAKADEEVLKEIEELKASQDADKERENGNSN